MALDWPTISATETRPDHCGRRACQPTHETRRRCQLICPAHASRSRALSGNKRQIPLLRNPGCHSKKKAHRVGFASVRLTRSTFAEATAGRESLQPRALRARCTRKSSGSIGRRQAPSQHVLSQIATFGIPSTQSSTSANHVSAVAPANAGHFRGLPRRRRGSSGAFPLYRVALRASRNQRSAPRPVRLRPAFRLTAAEATACRRAIDLQRSVLGAPGTLGGRKARVKSSVDELSRSLRNFPHTAVRLASDRVCSTKE